MSKMLIVSSPVYLVLGSSSMEPTRSVSNHYTCIAYAMDVDDDRGGDDADVD